MSPTEFELRSALHDGEGDGVDPDLVIGRAEGYRRQRRARVLGGLSAAALLVAGGTVAGVVLNGGSGGHSEATRGADSVRRGDVAGGVHAAPSAAEASGAFGAAAGCPAAVPTISAPTATRSATVRPLFGAGVRDVIICWYGPASKTTVSPSFTTVTGSTATDLVRSIDEATPKPSVACPLYRVRNPARLLLVARDAAGRASKPVLVTLGGDPCQAVVTNGTAVRYGWTPPASLADLLGSIAGSNAPGAPVPAPSPSSS